MFNFVKYIFCISWDNHDFPSLLLDNRVKSSWFSLFVVFTFCTVSNEHWNHEHWATVPRGNPRLDPYEPLITNFHQPINKQLYFMCFSLKTLYLIHSTHKHWNHDQHHYKFMPKSLPNTHIFSIKHITTFLCSETLDRPSALYLDQHYIWRPF